LPASSSEKCRHLIEFDVKIVHAGGVAAGDLGLLVRRRALQDLRAELGGRVVLAKNAARILR
jgi:hypothetical protein